MEKPSFFQVALAAAVMCLAAIFAVAMFSEWWPIIVTRSPAHIATYHFGSESMMGHGGLELPRFRGRVDYAAIFRLKAAISNCEGLT